MSVTKAALKAAKVALDKQKYDEAKEQARKVLAADPNNYHAYVYTPTSNYNDRVADSYNL